MLTVLGWILCPILGAVIGALFALFKSFRKESKALKVGIQALLRDRLIECHKLYKAQGYADIDDKQNFENLWKQYHALGVNGVMDAIHDAVLAMPTEKEEA